MAAIAVVFHHAAQSTDAFVQALPISMSRLLDLGALGVDFFFVLSGFIIMHAHMDEKCDRANMLIYAIKRATRLYPAYWPVAIAMLVLYSAHPSLSESGGREFSVLSSLLLVPSRLPPALSVAWTLVHEVMFYIVFLLWFTSQRLFVIGLVAWVVSISIAALGGFASGWLRYPLSVLNVEFIFGVVACSVYRWKDLSRYANMLMSVGVLLSASVLAMFFIGFAVSEMRLLLALGMSVLILGCAVQERQRSISWPSLLLALGSASFSIYLVHNPVLSVTQRFAGAWGLPWGPALIAGVMIAVGCGYVYHRAVERPMLHWARNLFSARLTPRAFTP